MPKRESDISEPARSPGRPSAYTEALADEICDRIANGETILDISESIGIKRTTINGWKDSHPEFASRIVRAREDQQDHFADRIIRLQQSATPETWQLVQFQVRTIQWHMSKLKAKQYGDKLDVDLKADMKIEKIILTMPALPGPKAEVIPDFDEE